MAVGAEDKKVSKIPSPPPLNDLNILVAKNRVTTHTHLYLYLCIMTPGNSVMRKYQAG